MRVMVAGTGDWTNRRIVQASIIVVNATMRTPEEHVTLVCGDMIVPVGMAVAAGYDFGWGVEEHQLNWDKDGILAVPRMNVKLLESGIDLLLVFKTRTTRDLAHLESTAQMMNIPTKVHTS